MSTQEVRILSYFSLPTDLAAASRDWPEFQSGDGYNVDLATATQTVQVRLVEPVNEDPYVTVIGRGNGRLFEQVLGAVMYALGKHSDNLIVDRVS